MESNKVLYITSRADIGGGPKHIIDLLENRPENFKILTALPYGQDYSQKIIALSDKTIPIPFRKFSFLAFFKILVFIKQNNIKVIHSHGRGAGIYSRLMKLNNIKVVHTFHGVHDECSLKGKVKLAIDRFLKNFTDQFICVSPSEKEKALRLKVGSLDKINIIFNGVKKQPDTNDTSTKKEIGIGMLGRLCHPKGFDIAIPYIDRFVLDYPFLGFKIEVAGDGEDYKKLQEILNDHPRALERINFIGKTLEPLHFLRKHPIFLSFSRFEGFPLAVLEAMSLGRACLLSDVVGNKDVNHNKIKPALLFNLHDYDDFKDKFSKLLSSKELQKDLSVKSVSAVNQYFSVEEMTLKTFSLY